MARPRVFLAQQTIDLWLATERIAVDGECLALPDGHTFQLKMAIHVVREVSGTADPHDLVGKVKDIDQIAALGGEHYADSLLVGENAYQVVEGFVGEGGPPNAFLAIVT